MVNKKINLKSIMMKNLLASIMLIMLMLVSVTGATYAWFIYEVSAPGNVFTAGTVQLSIPEEELKDTITEEGSKFAFVPNSGEASVSKVDLVSMEEVARYYTAPRENPDPYEWRTSRIAQDDDENVWVLNVGADGTGLQGSVVRIQADTEGLTSTHSYTDLANKTPGPLPFNTDDAVQVLDVGETDEMPRAIAIDRNGFIWIGFYGSGRLVQYAYNPAGPSLELQDEWTDSGLGFYEMKFATNGILFISSRQSTSQAPRPGIDTGIYSFDGTGFTKEASVNPYSILIAADDIVYATAYNNQLYIRDNGGNWSNVIITGSSNNRGMAFDNNGNIWISSTEGVTGGTTIYSYNIASGVPGDTYNLTSGTTPVGVGKDATGNMWAICRSDSDAQGWIEGFDPSDQTVVGAIQVGNRPYAYGDFSKPGSACKTVEWEFENVGSKSVYVRVKPMATVNGAPVSIKLCDDNAPWQRHSDGWWYYGTEEYPIVVHPKPENPYVVNVCFEYCFETSGSANQALEVSLVAEAVQWSNDAIHHEWQNHPWQP